MLGLLMPLPQYRGCRAVAAVCKEESLAKKGHNPPSSSSSLSCVPHVSSPLYQKKQAVYIPPRLCSLNEFGMQVRTHDEPHPGFLSSLTAIIELSAQIQNWERLSGRLAMMVFASALVLEALTGNSVFEKMESQRLLECCGATFVSILIAAGFAVALQAKAHMAYRVSKSYEKFINGFVDNVIDDLLFDNEDS